MENQQKIGLIRLEGLPIYEQLLLEEALLRADTENWCLINRGTSPAVVMGISGKPELLIHKTRFDQANIPLIQRFSGGGTVFVDHNTLFLTFICNALPGLPLFPQTLLTWSETVLKPAFASHPFALRENDYVLGDKKFGGNAQYLCKNRWLHHSSLLWDYDLEQMEMLLYPPKTPSYRGKRSHGEFLCPLSPHFPSKEALETALIHAIGKHFAIEETSLETVKDIQKRPHRVGTKKLLRGD